MGNIWFVCPRKIILFELFFTQFYSILASSISLSLRWQMFHYIFLSTPSWLPSYVLTYVKESLLNLTKFYFVSVIHFTPLLLWAVPHSIDPFGLPSYVLTSVKESPSKFTKFYFVSVIHLTTHFTASFLRDGLIPSPSGSLHMSLLLSRCPLRAY